MTAESGDSTLHLRPIDLLVGWIGFTSLVSILALALGYFYPSEILCFSTGGIALLAFWNRRRTLVLSEDSKLANEGTFSLLGTFLFEFDFFTNRMNHLYAGAFDDADYVTKRLSLCLYEFNPTGTKGL